MILGVFFGLQQWQKNRDTGPNFPDSPPAVTPNFPNYTPEELTEESFKEELETEPQQGSALEDEKAITLAVRTGEVELCQEINDEPMQQECEDNLNYPQFIQEGNPSECQSLHSPTLQQNCLDTLSYQKAIENRNRKQCEVIEDETLQDRCLTQLQSPEGCDSIENPNQKTDCEDQEKMGEAISEQNTQKCESIQNEILKDQCLSTIENNQAQANQISQESDEEEVSSILNQNDPLKRCELLINKAKQTCEDEVYFDLAFEEKNLIYCNQIKDETMKNRCRSQQQAAIDQYYLKVSANRSDCQLISNEELEELCTTKF